VARFGELVAARRRASVLPDDRSVQGLAGPAIPHHHGLALVGDADRRHRLAELADQLRERGLHCVPDLRGVVLDPAGTREVLRELPVRPAPWPSRLVHGEGPHAGGAGIDRHDDGHGRPPY
jgi:hypothetical protein